MTQLPPSVGGYASNTPFIMIIPGNFPTIPGYSENLPDYSRIFPDSFNHLLCSKLCRHNRRMPTGWLAVRRNPCDFQKFKFNID